MNSFLKSVKSMTDGKNKIVKDSLRKQLSASVTELRGIAESASGSSIPPPIGTCEESMTLCSILEAIFLHGLKDSLLNRVTEALSGPDFEAIPQPSFWGPLLVFSHRQIIDQIQSLPRITTEVGYCRAWLRLAMNEGLLSSYLDSIRRDNSALKPYYDRNAFVRDSEQMDVAQRLLESLARVNFELAYNSSLLNFWSNTPLLMAGIWSPPMKSCPVFSAVDIAKTINSDASDNLEDFENASSIGSLSSFNSSRSMLNNITSLTEDEALKIILKQDRHNRLGKISEKRRKKKRETERRLENNETGSERDESLENEISTIDDINRSEDQGFSSENEILTTDNHFPEVEEVCEHFENMDRLEEKDDPEKIEDSGTIGNSLIGRPGWSTSFDDLESNSMTTSVVSKNSGDIDAARTSGEGTTYAALIKSYHTAGCSNAPEVEESLDETKKQQPVPKEKEAKPKPEVKVLENFEDQIGYLPRERGLDVQNYVCYDCGTAIGMTFEKANVCFFTGNNYCTGCMAEEEYLIPSRIIHNWDLKHYPVCRRAGSYLTDCPTLLNLKIFNPKIYTAVDVMAQLQSLRIRLNLLRAYLFTCREPIIESLQKKVAPREYLYEHVHQYSVSDLLDVTSGLLAQQLQKIVQFARQHVLNCWLCSQKGFICEICNNPKVIYPFDMESTYRCTVCNAVFHADCLSSSKPCPKCERRRKRSDRSLPEIDNVDFFSSEIIESPSTSAI